MLTFSSFFSKSSPELYTRKAILPDFFCYSATISQKIEGIHKHRRVVTNVSHFPTFPQALPLFMSLACRRLGGWRKYTIFQQLSGKRSTRAGRKLTPMEYFTNNLGYLDTTITFAPEINTSFVSPRWRGSGTFICILVIKRSFSPPNKSVWQSAIQKSRAVVLFRSSCMRSLQFQLKGDIAQVNINSWKRCNPAGFATP